VVWKQGYDHALNQSSDLKQLLELEELLTKENMNGNIIQEECSVELNGSSAPSTVSEGHSGSETEASKDHNKSRDFSETSSESDHASEVQSKLVDGSHVNNGSLQKLKETKNFESKPNGTYKKLSSELESHTKPSDEPRNKISASKVPSKSNNKSSEDFEWGDAVKKIARFSKTKSINLDPRLSRGIAAVCSIILHFCVTIFWFMSLVIPLSISYLLYSQHDSLRRIHDRK